MLVWLREVWLAGWVVCNGWKWAEQQVRGWLVAGATDGMEGE